MLSQRVPIPPHKAPTLSRPATQLNIISRHCDTCNTDYAEKLPGGMHLIDFNCSCDSVVSFTYAPNKSL